MDNTPFRRSLPIRYFMNSKLKNSFFANVGAIMLVSVCLYILFFSTLGLITKHGSEATVPSVIGLTMEAANENLKNIGFDVSIDSAYDPQKRPLTVLAQIPDPKAIVKHGRTIFLTVNKKSPPLTAMPKLTSLSYRSAVMILRSNRLVLGDTTHRSDYAAGSILEQQYRGKVIEPGTMIPQGSRISLVVGDGLGNVEMEVPDVIGQSPEEGINLLSGYGFSVTQVWEDPITDSSSALIYSQSPAPFNDLDVPNRIREGDIIDIHIKQDPTKEEMEYNRRPARPVNESTPNPVNSQR